MICDFDKMHPRDQSEFKCVGIDQICDGNVDCIDGNDENMMQCYIKNKHTCTDDEFACPTERYDLNYES